MALLISIGIGLLGFLPLFIVLWKRHRAIQLVTKGDVVTGTVLDVYERRGHKGNVFYHAIIQYPVFNQAPIQGTYIFTGKKRLNTYYKGRRLEICYDKNKPKRFIPKEGTPKKGMLIFGIVFGIVYIVLAVCLYNFMKEQGIQ